MDLIKKNKEILNSIWIMGERVFNMMISLVVSVLTARYLGPSNYGTLNYTASFVAFATSIATLGMDGVVVKKIIENPKEEGDYLGSSIVFRLVSSVMSMITICAIVLFLNPNEIIKFWLVLIQSCQLMMKSVQILDVWFQRYLKAKYVSVGKMIACLVVSTYKFFLLVTAKNIIWFAFANVITDGLISLIIWIFYSKENTKKLCFSFKKGKEVLSESYHFILSGLMVAVYSQMDRIMIGKMLTDRDVGLYTTATYICSLWVFIPEAIINSFRPKMMELKINGKEDEYKYRLGQLYSGIIWLCIIFSLGITIFAKLIIWILYGESYYGAIDTLRIVIWFETFAMIGTARGIWILCENKNKYVKYYLLIGAVINVLLNYFLIPILGINGAAVATLITQFTTSMIAPLFFSETRIHTKIVMKSLVCYWHWKREPIQPIKKM